MDLLTIAIAAAGLLIYSLFSGRLQGTIVTAPLVFVVFGYAIGIDGFNIASFDVDHSAIHFIAEITLILVLFTDAAPIARLYDRFAKRMGECEENQPTAELPLRAGHNKVDK